MTRETTADSTQELDAVDFIEETTGESHADFPVVLDAPTPPAPTVPRRVAPEWRDATASILLKGTPRRELRAIVGFTMAACVGVLVAAGVRAGLAAGGQGQAAAPAPEAIIAPAVDPRETPPSTSSDTRPASTNTASWATVGASPPNAFSATVTVAPGAAPVTIDGARTTARSHTVPCGDHVVRVGKGKGRPVTLACGSELVVERDGSLRVK